MLTERKKYLFLIGGFIVIVLGIAFLLWQVFFKPAVYPLTSAPALSVTTSLATLPAPQPALPSPGVAPPPPRISPEEGVGRLPGVQTLTPAPTLAPILGPQGRDLYYYNRQDGKLYRFLDGKAEPLAEQVFYQARQLTWSPNREQVIVGYPDNTHLLYNLKTKQSVTLPRHWEQFSFSPSGDKIAFLSLGQDKNTRWLAIASPDGSAILPIEPLGDNADKVQVAWSPNDQVLAFSRTGAPGALQAQEILLVGKQGENFPSLTVAGVGFKALWSPSGEALVYSVTVPDQNWKPQLWVTSGSLTEIGVQERPLPLNTWVDKCAFASGSVLYCAVPRALPEGAGIYPASVGNTPDDLYRVNLVSGAVERLPDLAEEHTLGQLVVDPEERRLYFTDALSGQLFSRPLK